MDVELFVQPCAGSREVSQGKLAPTGDAAQGPEKSAAREWVCTHGPQVELLISRMFAFAPDLVYAIDVKPDASPPTVSITLWCNRTQLFRFDLGLSTTDNYWHAETTARLGAGPTMPAAHVPAYVGYRGHPHLTPEAVVAAFRRSLRAALRIDFQGTEGAEATALVETE